MSELTITSPLCRLQSRLQHIYHGHIGQPYARVYPKSMPESTLSPVRDLVFGLWNTLTSRHLSVCSWQYLTLFLADSCVLYVAEHTRNILSSFLCICINLLCLLYFWLLTVQGQLSSCHSKGVTISCFCIRWIFVSKKEYNIIEILPGKCKKNIQCNVTIVDFYKCCPLLSRFSGRIGIFRPLR